MTTRSLVQIIQSIATADGAGVKLRRSLGSQRGVHVDPFLMLDEFYSDNPDDYLAGFPAHPHRGFETVTYLFDGAMEHRDSTGGGGLLRGGDTQWMTAGAGLVHSETPTAEMLRDGGLMHGLQLWVNLPRADKLTPPRYQDLSGDKLTLARTRDGKTLLRLVAGELGGQTGPGSTHTPIVYAHATVEAGGGLALDWPADYNALVYVLSGEVRIGGDSRVVGEHQLAVLGREGDAVVIEADASADLLLLGGRPLREPVAWYGPFVMNTKQEIVDSLELFERGELGSIPPRVGD